MKKATLSILSLLAVLLLGCEPCRHYNRLEVAPFAGAATTKAGRKPYGSVTPYETAAEVKRPFAIVAYMSCEAPTGDEAAVLKAMLYRAADLGADGIVLNPTKVSGEDTGGNKMDIRVGWGLAGMAMGGSGSQHAYRCQAIKFKD